MRLVPGLPTIGTIEVDAVDAPDASERGDGAISIPLVQNIRQVIHGAFSLTLIVDAIQGERS
jgi:hypothetical protein